jgi:nicotinamide mononucleotide transporter
MLLDWLNATAVTILSEPASWAELLGFATGLLCVWLVVRQHIANWPVGIVNVALLMVAFWTAGLYADASLQVVYVVLGVYGWWQWTVGGLDRSALEVRRTSRAEWMCLIGAGTAATAVMWWLLSAVMHSTVPLADAITTSLSLVATYGQSKKLFESWWLWIAADIIYIPLYAYKGLYLTTVLYVVFLGLCVLGLTSWRAALRRNLVTRHVEDTYAVAQ